MGKKVWHAYAMLLVSCMLLIASGAVALGAFGFTDSAPQVERSDSTPAAKAARATIAVASLVITYYLADSEAYRASLDSLKDQLVQAEWLQKTSFEVLVVSSAETESAARREIDAAKARSPTSRVLVEDLRAAMRIAR